MAFLDDAGLVKLWQHIQTRLSNKVDKVAGKGLSSNDFTNEDKEKLASFTESAQPDWNVNDETASDYIKNRPFYDNRVIEPVYILTEVEAVMPDLDESGNLVSDTAYFYGGSFSELVEYKDYYMKLICEYPDGTVTTVFDDVEQYRPESQYYFNNYKWQITLSQYNNDMISVALQSRDDSNSTIFNINNTLKLSIYSMDVVSGELVCLENKFLPTARQHFKTTGAGWYCIGKLTCEDFQHKKVWHDDQELTNIKMFIGTALGAYAIEIITADSFTDVKVIAGHDHNDECYIDRVAIDTYLDNESGDVKGVLGRKIYVRYNKEPQNDVYISIETVHGLYSPYTNIVRENIAMDYTGFRHIAYLDGMHLSDMYTDEYSDMMGISFSRKNNADSLNFFLVDGQPGIIMNGAIGSTTFSAGTIFTSSYKPTAADVTAGTFGGTVTAGSTVQDPATSLLRNTKLVESETTPTVNGEICWLYE